MNCENALELMNRELDEALTAEESAALQAHLDACPDCRETWRQLHELDALLQESELEPPAALHDGVMQAIRQEQKRKPRRAWLPAAAIAAAAALVLLAGKAGLIALPGFEQTDVISVNIGSAVEQIFAPDRWPPTPVCCTDTGPAPTPPRSRRRSLLPRRGWMCCWCGTAAFRLNWKQRRMKRRRTARGCTA